MIDNSYTPSIPHATAILCFRYTTELRTGKEENDACGDTSAKNEPTVIATMIIST